MTTIILRVLLFIVTLLTATQAWAVNLSDIEHYLNSISSMSADFTQVSPNNQVRYGQMHLLKPGKIRWEYNKPNNVLIIGNKDQFIYYDAELEEVTYLSTQSALGTFLTQHIQFGQNLKVIKHTSDAECTDLTVYNPKAEQNTEVTIHLQNKPLSIIGFTVIENGERVVDIAFTNVKMGIPIDNKLFDFHNPKFFNLNR